MTRGVVGGAVTVDPQLYLTQALTNVPQASGTDLERWLPDRWKVEQAHRVKQLGG